MTEDFVSDQRNCRSELAREEPEDAADIQNARVIVNALREQARSYRVGGVRLTYAPPPTTSAVRCS